MGYYMGLGLIASFSNLVKPVIFFQIQIRPILLSLSRLAEVAAKKAASFQWILLSLTQTTKPSNIHFPSYFYPYFTISVHNFGP